MYPQPITPRNKLPDEYVYSELLEIMEDRKQYRVKAGHNTYAALVKRNGEQFIEVIHYTACIAHLYPSGDVVLFSCNLYNPTIADRMSRCVSRLGYSVEHDVEHKRYWITGRNGSHYFSRTYPVRSFIDQSSN
jgi:hypothetical protein